MTLLSVTTTVCLLSVQYCIPKLLLLLAMLLLYNGLIDLTLYHNIRDKCWEIIVLFVQS